MRISLSVSDPASLVALRHLPLVEAMGYAMLELTGGTRVELLYGTLEDDSEVFRRAVELLTFLITVQRRASGFLEFALEPAATYVETAGKIRLFDFFEQDRLLDEMDDRAIEANISAIDAFLESALTAHSPPLLEHLLKRRFLGPALSPS